jgi:hypothetical protein
MDTEPNIKQLYPELDETQLCEAQQNIEQYLLVVLRIYERVSARSEGRTHVGALTTGNGTLPCTPPKVTGLTATNSQKR